MGNGNIQCIGHKLQYGTQAAAHLVDVKFVLAHRRPLGEINNLGVEEKLKMDLFFLRECLLRFIYFFLEKGLRDFFFLISSGPPPTSLMVVPLLCKKWNLVVFPKNKEITLCVYSIVAIAAQNKVLLSAFYRVWVVTYTRFMSVINRFCLFTSVIYLCNLCYLGYLYMI